MKYEINKSIFNTDIIFRVSYVPYNVNWFSLYRGIDVSIKGFCVQLLFYKKHRKLIDKEVQELKNKFKNSKSTMGEFNGN